MSSDLMVLRFPRLEGAEQAFADVRAHRSHTVDGRGRLRRASPVRPSGRARNARRSLPRISGPTGAVFAQPTESFRGHGDRRAHEDERELVLEEISRDLEPGVTLVIAEIADPDPGVLDSALEALGGSVTRRAAREVYAELDAASGSTGRP